MAGRVVNVVCEGELSKCIRWNWAPNSQTEYVLAPQSYPGARAEGEQVIYPSLCLVYPESAPQQQLCPDFLA